MEDAKSMVLLQMDNILIMSFCARVALLATNLIVKAMNSVTIAWKLQ